MSTYLGLLTMILWSAVIILWFFSGFLWSRLWVFAPFIDICVRAVSIVVTAVWLGSLLRHRRWLGALGVGLIAVGIACVVMLDLWTTVYPRVWFWASRDLFVRAEQMARGGSLHGDIHDYYGAQLPVDLAAISVDGGISITTGWTDYGDLVDVCGADRPILFAPAWTGIPDGAVGFVHIPCDVPADLVLDGFADDMCPSYPLADGWWWADGASCDRMYR